MPIKVALCEDNDSFRESLQQYIADTSGLEVTASLSNAAGIVEQLAADVPHVLLMDIDMPGMNGIEAAALVKAAYPQANVLMLTVYEDDEKIFKAILAGATGYLLKKTLPQKIIEAITEVHEGGATMSASIVKKVLNFFHHTPEANVSNAYALSEREKDILRCIVAGDSYKMIADHCHINIGTVRSHINNIYKKLHINSKSEAVAKAIKEKLVSE
jgi:DNA-binding NarL/FixJ family response regulator